MSIETVERGVMYSIAETAKRLGGISRTTLYELIQDGRIETRHIGRRTFVTAEEIARFIASLGGE